MATTNHYLPTPSPLGTDPALRAYLEREFGAISRQFTFPSTYPMTGAEEAAGVTPKQERYPEAHAFRYMTDDQIAAVIAGNGSQDVTAPLATLIAVISATSFRRRGYCPRGLYPHSGLVFDTQGTGLYGDGRRESVLVYSGSGHGIDVESGAHNVGFTDLQMHGNASALSLLRLTGAGDGYLERVHLSINGGTGDCLILQGSATEGTFYFRCVDSMIDGGATAARAVLMQIGPGLSGPNGAYFVNTRVQQVTTAFDINDTNELAFNNCELELDITTGFDIKGSSDIVLTVPRFDWNVAGSTGIAIDAASHRVCAIVPRHDIAGAGSALWSDASTDSLLIRGDAFTSNALGFFGTAAVAQPTVTGSRGGNAALASLLTGLAALGLVADSSSP